MAEDGIPWEPVALAATRWTMLRGWAIPLWSIMPVVGIPILLTMLTFNALWLFLVPLLGALVRALVGEDQNRPRLAWLGFLSGQTFADRQAWGGASRDPLDA